MTAVDYLNLVISALLLAGIYAAMSVGMTVIYGVMKIVNLAHAGFLMLGAYFAYEMFERFHIDPIFGAGLALPVFFLFGMVVHWVLIRWLPKSDTPTKPQLTNKKPQKSPTILIAPSSTQPPAPTPPARKQPRRCRSY